MSDENKRILYDAETDRPNIQPDDVMSDLKKALFTPLFTEAENKQEDNSSNSEEPYTIDENSPNVFSKGLNDGKFILHHRCPMCMFSKRNVCELHVQKRFRREKVVVGYMTTCANCGHVDFYTDNPRALLKYFQGKTI